MTRENMIAKAYNEATGSMEFAGAMRVDREAAITMVVSHMKSFFEKHGESFTDEEIMAYINKELSDADKGTEDYTKYNTKLDISQDLKKETEPGEVSPLDKAYNEATGSMEFAGAMRVDREAAITMVVSHMKSYFEKHGESFTDEEIMAYINKELADADKGTEDYTKYNTKLDISQDLK